MTKFVFMVLACLVMGCASAHDQPYYTMNTDLKCDAIGIRGDIPILDPTQTYSVCEDRNGHFYFPNGVLANTDIAGASGLISAMVQQSAQVGAMLGGF